MNRAFPFFERYWLALVAWGLCVAVVPAALWRGGGSLLALYWAALLLALGVVASAVPFPVRGPAFPRLRHAWWPALALFCLALYRHFAGLGAAPLTLDEDMFAARVLRQESLVEAAALLQQPPLGAYFLWDAFQVSGVNLLAARALPAFFGAASVPLLFSLLARAGVGSAFSFFGACILLADGFLLRHAREARPYSWGIFFLLLYFHALISDAREPWGWRPLVRLTIATLFSICALGVQPVLVVAAAAVAYAFAHRGGRERFHPLLALGAAVLLFGPFQAELARFYPHYLAGNFLHPLATAARGFGALVALLPGALSRVWPFFLPLAAALLLPRRRGAERSPLLETFLLVPPLALAPYVVFLGGLADWMPQVRYLMLYRVAVLVSGVMALGWLAGRARPRWKAGAALAVACGALALVMGRTPVPREPRWQAFYAYLSRAAEPGTRAFMFSVSKRETRTMSGFPGMDFYYSPELAQKVKLRSAWELGRFTGQMEEILRVAESGEEPRLLLFFDDNQPGTRSLLSFRLSDAEFIRLPDPMEREAVVARIPNVTGLRPALRKLLLEIDEQETREELKFQVHLGLAGLAFLEGKCGEGRASLERARLVPGRSGRPPDYSYYDELGRKCASAPGSSAR